MSSTEDEGEFKVYTRIVEGDGTFGGFHGLELCCHVDDTVAMLKRLVKARLRNVVRTCDFWFVLNGRRLVDDRATLVQVGIGPGTVVHITESWGDDA